jgi:hypothetical protein
MNMIEGFWRINYMTAMRSGMALIIVKEKNLIGADSQGNHWDGHYKFNNDSTATFTFNVHYINGISILSENVTQKSSHQKFEVVLPEDIIEDKIYTSDAVSDTLVHIVFNKLRPF